MAEAFIFFIGALTGACMLYVFASIEDRRS